MEDHVPLKMGDFLGSMLIFQGCKEGTEIINGWW